MTRIHFAIFVCAFALTSSVDARMPNPTDVNEKLKAASIVVIVEAVGAGVPDPPIWAVQKFERLRVIRTLKGRDVPDTLIFVTSGFSHEQNPRCCVDGGRYLLLLNRGYPVFEQVAEKDVIVLKEPEKYVSGSDGSYSAYQLDDDKVIGWPSFGDTRVKLNQVEREIGNKSGRVQF